MREALSSHEYVVIRAIPNLLKMERLKFFFVLPRNSKTEQQSSKFICVLERIQGDEHQASRIPGKERPDKMLSQLEICKNCQNGASQGSVDIGQRSKVKQGLNRTSLNLHEAPERKSTRS